MHIVYLTINIKNRKIYVGVHSTNNDAVFDGYIGNGVNIYQPSSIKHPKTIFQKAVKKYGFNSFERITLFRCSSKEEAYELESILVNEEFLNRDDVYNMKLGGIISPDCSKEIHQYTLEGDFIKSWPSLESASKELGCSDMTISYAHLNKSIGMKSLWSLEKYEKLDTTLFKNIPQEKTVYKYDTNGKFLTFYNSCGEAAKALQTSRENVRDSIKNKYLCKGFYLSYEKSDILLIEAKIKRTSADKVYQYNLEGLFLREFLNCEEAALAIGGSKKSLQSKMATNNSYKKYQWSYTKKESLKNIRESSLSSAPKQINQFDLNGTLIKTWQTYNQCRQSFPNVGKVLRGVTKKCKGFTFKYAD
jgi:hypothetical protein